MISIGFTGSEIEKAILPNVLKRNGLATYEYGAGRGAYPSQAVRDSFKASDLKFSIHAPYFLSMTNRDKLDKNLEMVERYCSLAPTMSVDRLIIHAGNLKLSDRSYAYSIAKYSFKEAVKIADKYGVTICPETVGKCKVFGNTREVLQLCKEIPQLIPCFDIGHMNCTSNGLIHHYTIEHWKQFLIITKNIIGEERQQTLHWHVSKIEYANSNEVRHLSLDADAEPRYDNWLTALVLTKSNSRIICESSFNQLSDALKLKSFIEGLQ